MGKLGKRHRSASRHARVRPSRFVAAWLDHHLQVALASLGRLLGSPWPMTMTVAVIAIALALPASLYVLTLNLSTLGGSWDETSSISLFLTPDTGIEQARTLAAELEEYPALERVTLISPDEALAELASEGGFSDAIAQLEQNPLPVVLALQPATDRFVPETLERLRRELEALPQADFARLDSQWVRRFHAILNLLRRGVLLLGGALAVAVMLVVGNTIRLEIENRRSEIEIMELVGATPAFIRRPFLYTGCWYGLLGGIGAWLLVTVGLALIQDPVSRLASLYQSQFPLSGLGSMAVFAMLGGSVCLGLLGSWISVGRHLSAVEPR